MQMTLECCILDSGKGRRSDYTGESSRVSDYYNVTACPYKYSPAAKGHYFWLTRFYLINVVFFF